MNVSIAGLWHLGCVISAGMARAGHRVTVYDPDPRVRQDVGRGKAPLFEPGLDDALSAGLQNGSLIVAETPAALLRQADILWVAYDTPVREDDTADTDFVRNEILSLLPHAPAGLLALISSQLPAGSIRLLEENTARTLPDRNVHFACSPENLRLGQALDYFMKPDRLVAGVRTEDDRRRLTALWAPLCCPVEWMSVESAEMAKHAINTFLALSVTFANELACLCEKVGADAREVERALKTESRIGPRAYVRPGRAFDGGTLSRDVRFLTGMAERQGTPVHLIPAIQISNESHKSWIFNAVKEALASAPSAGVAVLGLTYKPGTDTLRRSASVEFCRRAAAQGWSVRAFDPRIRAQPGDWPASVALCGSVSEACDGAGVIVVATEWPEFKAIPASDWIAWAPGAWIVDPNRFLFETCGLSRNLRYRAVGMGGERHG